MLTVAAILLAIPLVLTGALWAGQERLIFLPDARALAAPAGWQREVLRSADGLDLAFLAIEGRPGQPVVLHFHGNGGNAADRTGLGGVLHRAGLGVVLAGYRGYGGNPGHPGEEAFAADADRLLAWVQTRFPRRPVVLWGESLGSGVAARLAEGRDDIAAVILESPFASVAEVARETYPFLPTDLLLRHRFEVLARMPNIAAPVLVVASEGDRITPLAQARRVAAAAPRGRILVEPGGAHPALLNAPTGEPLRTALRFIGEVGQHGPVSPAASG